MNVKLIMAKGRPREHTIQLHSAETVVGRHRECNLRIPSNDVSRRHCVLRFKDGLLTVEDLKSTNGTHINGQPVTGVQPVHPGDLLEIGPVSFTVEYEGAVAPGEAPVEELEIIPVEEDDGVIVIEEADADVLNFETQPNTPKPPPIPAADGKPGEAKPAEEDEVLEVEFDLDAQPLQLPEEGNLRDILSRLDH